MMQRNAQPPGPPPNPFALVAEFFDPKRTTDGWRAVAREKQLPPPGDWFTWLLMAGRGFGKTRAGIEWLDEKARTKCRRGDQVLLAGRTPADVRTFSLQGPGGLLTNHPDVRYFPSKRELLWPNGVIGVIRSGANPEEFRGFSGEYALLEELAAWQYAAESYSNLMLGMREGASPRVAIATTPRPIKLIREIMEAPGTVVVRGSSYENRDNLAASYVENVLDPMSQTRLGRQEVFAELLDEIEGALWRMQTDHTVAPPLLGIEDTRHAHGALPEMVRIVVGVDPQGKKRPGSETGIVAGGKATNGHYYVLADSSINGAPSEWGAAVSSTAKRWGADRTVGEANFGGDMVESTLRSVAPELSYANVHAARGKTQRAEPIAALYEMGLVHHVGQFPELEDEMTTFVAGEGASPNRMDALVWCLTELSTPSAKKAKRGGTWGKKSTGLRRTSRQSRRASR